MKISKVIIFFLTILFFSSLANDNAFSQILERDRLEINISYLVPHSEVVFKRAYGGIIGLDLKYLHQLKSHLLLGALFEHSRFKIDDPEVIEAAPITRHTKSNTSSGAIVGGVEYPLNKIINATFQIGLGYSWISLKNKPNNFSLKESGPMLRFLFAT